MSGYATPVYKPTVVPVTGLSLPVVSADYQGSGAKNGLSAPSTSKLFPSGVAYHNHARRILNQRTFEEDDKAVAAEMSRNGTNGVEELDEDADLGNEQEDKHLLKSDPKQWKQQDHYAVLGLQRLRYKATDEQIKKAHRRKVLRHHPDKKAYHGGSATDDSFFKCIAKAMEVLSNQEKRRQFDSVDPAIDDDDVPEPKEVTPENFFEKWGPVFEREGRFSNRQPVPSLGDKDTSKQEVESFYDFWYNFDSWRSFEYLDKDAPEGTDSRDEKRHQEKKNKSERAKRKKEDIARLRDLVDRALATDPRIKQFKAAEKAAREAKRRGGAPGAPAVNSDPKVRAEEERKKKEEEEKRKEEEAKKAAADKQDREAAKKAKEAAKKNVKKDKKAISTVVTTGVNYFCPAGTSPSPSVVEKVLTELDAIFGALEPEQVAEARKQVEAAGNDGDKVKAVIVDYANQVKAKDASAKFEQFA